MFMANANGLTPAFDKSCASAKASAARGRRGSLRRGFGGQAAERIY